MRYRWRPSVHPRRLHRPSVHPSLRGSIGRSLEKRSQSHLRESISLGGSRRSHAGGDALARGFVCLEGTVGVVGVGGSGTHMSTLGGYVATVSKYSGAMGRTTTRRLASIMMNDQGFLYVHSDNPDSLCTNSYRRHEHGRYTAYRIPAQCRILSLPKRSTTSPSARAQSDIYGVSRTSIPQPTHYKTASRPNSTKTHASDQEPAFVLTFLAEPTEEQQKDAKQ
ncbi:hypothetical protein OH77DRAFT_352045 [Trametes cingulata]|nr:hypothetical protein OH77DRAFT_352045 [Trametes cingulata]